MKNVKRRVIIGLIISLIGIGLIIARVVSNYIYYFENDGPNFKPCYAIVTEVFPNNEIKIQYKVDNKDYEGTISVYNSKSFDVDYFKLIYYNQNNPSIITDDNYYAGVSNNYFYLAILIIALIVIIYIVYKYIQLLNHSTRKPVTLIGYDKGKLVFIDKEDNNSKKKLYYSRSGILRTKYEELKANNNLEAELVVSTKHPNLWSIDLTKLMEVQNEEN